MIHRDVCEKTTSELCLQSSFKFQSAFKESERKKCLALAEAKG
jgi:hypothetical protein